MPQAEADDSTENPQSLAYDSVCRSGLDPGECVPESGFVVGEVVKRTAEIHKALHAASMLVSVFMTTIKIMTWQLIFVIGSLEGKY